MTEFLRGKNANAEIFLISTWPRAAHVYPLWTFDSYHASTHGYYLQALMIFGALTGNDPRSLGDGECSAYELGMSRAETCSLQQVAFDQLGDMVKTPMPPPAAGTQKPAPARGCASGR